MNIVKILLVALGLIVAAMLALSFFSVLYTALWYLFFIGVLAVGGAVGYKFLVKKPASKRLNENTPIAIAEMDRADRTLEEYKKKYLAE